MATDDEEVIIGANEEEYEYTSKLLNTLVDENNQYNYVLKKWIFDWMQQNNIHGETFWKAMVWNDRCGFFLCDERTMKEFLCEARFAEDFGQFEGHGEALDIFISVIENSRRQCWGSVDWNYIALNPHSNAISIIEKNMDKMTNEYKWYPLSKNKNAIHIIEKNIDKIDEFNAWSELCKNPSALEIIQKYKNSGKFENNELCRNENPEILKLIELEGLSDNDWGDIFSNPGARFIIEKNMDKLNDTNRYRLFENPSVVDIIEKELEKGLDDKCMESLCRNINASHIIEKYIEKLNENAICILNTNAGAIHLLEKNPQLVDSTILQNPAIFESK